MEVDQSNKSELLRAKELVIAFAAIKRGLRNLDFITWSRLASMGNHPVVKLAILAPLFAQVLIHEKTIAFLGEYNFTNLERMYFSLMFFFVAQLIYNIRCHRDIKHYPSEVKYTQALDAVSSDEELNMDYFGEYKKYFRAYGGLINEEKFDLIEAHRFASIHETRRKREDPSGTYEDLQNVVHQAQTIYSSVKTGIQSETVDWRLLSKCDVDVLMDIFQIEYKTGEIREIMEAGEFQALLENVNTVVLSSHWRANALRERFYRHNTAHGGSRYIAGMFYIIGATYFVIQGISNTVKVLERYL